MTQAFVSYCQSDRHHAQIVVGALARWETQFWVDWERLPRTPDWQSHVTEAIAQSAHVIAVVSEAYFESEQCGFELDQAVTQGRPIIAAVREEPSAWTDHQSLFSGVVALRDRHDGDRIVRLLRATVE